MPALKIWDLSEPATTVGEEGERYAFLNRGKGIRVPLRSFAGEMGVVRHERGA